MSRESEAASRRAKFLAAWDGLSDDDQDEWVAAIAHGLAGLRPTVEPTCDYTPALVVIAGLLAGIFGLLAAILIAVT